MFCICVALFQTWYSSVSVCLIPVGKRTNGESEHTQITSRLKRPLLSPRATNIMQKEALLARHTYKYY